MFLLQTVADSALAADVGTAVGTQTTVLVLSGLGLVSKFVTSLAAKVIPQWDGLGDTTKAVVALLFAQVVVFANWRFGLAMSTDVTLLGTTLTGVATWLAAMGWHRLSKFLPMNS